jgi:hypothetical protein
MTSAGESRLLFLRFSPRIEFVGGAFVLTPSMGAEQVRAAPKSPHRGLATATISCRSRAPRQLTNGYLEAEL